MACVARPCCGARRGGAATGAPELTTSLPPFPTQASSALAPKIGPLGLVSLRHTHTPTHSEHAAAVACWRGRAPAHARGGERGPARGSPPRGFTAGLTASTQGLRRAGAVAGVLQGRGTSARLLGVVATAGRGGHEAVPPLRTPLPVSRHGPADPSPLDSAPQKTNSRPRRSARTSPRRRATGRVSA